MTDAKYHVIPLDTPMHLTEKGRRALAQRDGPALLERIGRLIWGADWKLPMAETMYYNERSVRRWANGTWNIPPNLWPRLRAKLLEHADDMRELAGTLPKGPIDEED